MKRILILLLSLVSVFSALADDGPKIQAIINQAIASSQKAVIPAGTYYVASTVSIAQSVSVSGSGAGVTSFVQQGPCVFSVNTPYPVHFSDFTIVGQGVQGNAIQVQGGNSQSTFEKLNFSQVYNGLVFYSADTYQITDCHFNYFTGNAIYISNPSVPDAGDSDVSGCQFFTPSGNGGICIDQTSGDGLRITNCKMLGGCIGYCKNSAQGSQGDLIITGCSIENNSISGIYLQGPFYDIVIANNELQSQPFPILLAGAINMSITGNVIQSLLGDGIVALNCFGSITGNTVSAKAPMVISGGNIQQANNSLYPAG